MRASVRAAFVPFSAKFEGVVPWLYLDVKGLVTTAIGNLVDPVETALAVPFVHKGTDIPATEEAIRREWRRVKEDPNAARRGHRSLEAATSLRLTPAGIDLVVSRRLAINDQFLRGRFPEFESWPADAQLATHSMAWACGPMFRFVALEYALRKRDFATAALECRMNTTGNPGLVPRNFANKTLYNNAARVVRGGLDPDVLLYGTDASSDVAPAAANDTTPAVIDGGTVHPEFYGDDEPPPEAA